MGNICQNKRIAVKAHNLTVIIFIALGVIFIVALSASADSIGANVSLTTGEWVYFALWKLEANGLTGPIFASSRPFDRDEIARIVAAMREKIADGQLNPNPHEMRLIEKLEAEFFRDLKPEGVDVRGALAGEFGYHDEWDTPSIPLWGAASYHPTPGVTLYEEFDIGKGRQTIGEEGKTASRRTNIWRWDYTANFRQAYMLFRREPFSVLIGRQPIFWGPSFDGSLIVSDESPAFDMILLNARFGPVKAIAFTALLDKKYNREREDRNYLANRYLTGHRIDWVVNSRIELGLSEVLLYGGDARDMELQYMNPLLPYYANQWNSNDEEKVVTDDNVLISADFAIRPIDGLKIYGQFLVDDFNYTRKTSRDPDALGYLGGLYLSDPLGISGTDFRAEYARIDSFTYTHLVPENQFTHYGWIIGHHLGPDADQILVELSKMIKVDGRLKLNYTFERQGSRTVADRYRDEDYDEMSFPSGDVERQHRFGLQFLWEPIRGPRLNISWQRLFISNQNGEEWKNELKITASFLSGLRRPK